MSKYDVEGALQKLGITYRVSGNELDAPCPIHKETKPSFHVNKETGGFHCFGCSAGGTLPQLVQELLKLPSWKEGLDWLRSSGFIRDELEQTKAVRIVPVVPDTKNRFVIPSDVKFGELENWPSGIRKYAISRGITNEQVRRWGIGYCTVGRLEGRIVFPIRGMDGVIRSYTARTFCGGDPRYQTPAPRENADPYCMFGENHWPLSKEFSTVFVTEGAINALALERAGAKYVAAFGGTPLSAFDPCRSDSVKASGPAITAVLRLRAFGRVAIAVDSDSAGEKMAKAISAALPNSVRVEFQIGMDAADVPTELLSSKIRHADSDVV